MSLPLSIGLRYAGTKKHNALLAFLARISILGLAVGVGLLITVLSVMNGFDRELKQKILALMPQGIIYHHDGIEDWHLLKQRLLQQPGIVAASPFVELNGLVSKNTAAEPVVLYGISPDEEIAVSQLHTYIRADVMRQLSEGARGLVLGKPLADKLQVQVGEMIMLIVPDTQNTQTAAKLDYFTVLGVLETKTELDQHLAITSLEAAAQLNGSSHVVSGMRVKVADLFAARNLVWQAVMGLGEGYYGTSWMTTHGNLYTAIQMSKNLVGLLMSLIVAIAAFNVVSTLVMVVVEKQGDIAILRTLGLSTYQIMQIFMVQGTLIGVIGTSLGVLGGLGLSLCVESLVRAIEAVFHVQFLKTDVYPLTYLPAEIVWGDVAKVACTALLMSFVATLYPSFKAARIQPAEALRYE
ncbi:MAG TPA: lipoprotein-releasing ABC transporter permease subunit [Cellvibrionaceae bacterium]|nr:lipoprotein-releasing ABC transporter permease subunit [Cellvibrionaceae bacterium]